MFFLGIFIGGLFGFILAAVCAAAHDREEMHRRDLERIKKSVESGL